jgi:hypothetical protein
VGVCVPTEILKYNPGRLAAEALLAQGRRHPSTLAMYVAQ